MSDEKLEKGMYDNKSSENKTDEENVDSFHSPVAGSDQLPIAT